MKKIIIAWFFLHISWFVAAQNLLINGEFDTNSDGWSSFETIGWVNDDGASISGNGSMLHTGSLNNNGSFPAISEKFVVQPFYQYLTGGSFKVPSDSAVPWVWYWIYWYDDMDGVIGQSAQVTADFGVPNDSWENLAGMSQAPVDAVMGELRIYFQTGEPSNPDTPYGLWDDVFVLEETIFISGFD